MYTYTARPHLLATRAVSLLDKGAVAGAQQFKSNSIVIEKLGCAQLRVGPKLPEVT